MSDEYTKHTSVPGSFFFFTAEMYSMASGMFFFFQAKKKCSEASTGSRMFTIVFVYFYFPAKKKVLCGVEIVTVEVSIALKDSRLKLVLR